MIDPQPLPSAKRNVWGAAGLVLGALALLGVLFLPANPAYLVGAALPLACGIMGIVVARQRPLLVVSIIGTVLSGAAILFVLVALALGSDREAQNAKPTIAPSVVAKISVETKIASDLADMGADDPQVDCPAHLPTGKGSTFRCKYELGNGRSGYVKVTLTSSDGDFDWDAD